MGAPSVPPIIQQPAMSAKPTQAEKDAAKQALDQKKAALSKIRQDVFARSQGLRGAASMYDFAGRTPHLAGDPRYQPPAPTPAAPTPVAKPQPQPNPWSGPNKMRTTIGPVNDFEHNPFPANPNPSRGPAGDRDPGSRTIGGAPKNTGAVPGGPLLNAPYGGRPEESGLTRESNLTRLGAGGRTPQAYATGGPKEDRYSIQPGGRPADSYLKPYPTIPKPGTGILGVAQHPLYPVGTAGAPKNQPAPTTTPAPGTGMPWSRAAIQAHPAQYKIYQANQQAAATQPAPAKPGAATQSLAQPAQPQAARLAAAQTVRQPAQTLGTVPRMGVAQPQPTSIFQPAPVARPAAAAPRPVAQPPAPNLGGAPRPIAVLPTPARLVAKPPIRQGAVLSGRR